MKRNLQGYYISTKVANETVKSFVPEPLPPKLGIDWTPLLRDKFDRALMALGRLDSVSTLLPDTSFFLYMYVRKEALLSSMIEGTQSSLSELLLFEIEQQPGAPMDDVQEVSCYVAALEHGLMRLSEGFPLCLRLLKEIHAILLSKGRGRNQTPGEFRNSQNWIGGTRPGNAAFVPPPPDKVLECMSSLERFLHDLPAPTPVLLKAALAHVQFETIHPFLDGNGRLGRLLITFLLCEQKALQRPLLYLSLYFKTHRERYYELLNTVRLTGDWEAWLDFFAEAVIETATQAVNTAQRILALAREDDLKIDALGRAAAGTRRLHRALLEHPLVTPVLLSRKTGLSPATVNKGLAHLVALGIAREVTARRRNRIFSYFRYIEILNEGTEPFGA